MKVEVIQAEAARLSPGEVLVLRLPDEATREVAHSLGDTLKQLGIADRTLVVGGGIELAIVPKEQAA